MARASSAPSLKLVASLKLPTLQEDADDAASSAAEIAPMDKTDKSSEPAAAPSSSMALIGIAVGVVAGVAILAVVLTKGKK